VAVRSNFQERTRIFSGRAARFEFRIFQPDLGPLPGMLKAVMGHGRSEAAVDHYVLAGRPELSMKFRRGAAELKKLRGREGSLEQWQPIGIVHEPGAAEELVKLVGGDLPVSLPQRRFGSGQDLQAWLSLQPGISVVSVRKLRQNYHSKGVRAELTRLTVAGVHLQSFAAECDRPEPLNKLLRWLALSETPNVSYPRLLEDFIRPDAQFERQARPAKLFCPAGTPRSARSVALFVMNKRARRSKVSVCQEGRGKQESGPRRNLSCRGTLQGDGTTRHILLPTSSATKSAPSASIATPTGRP
jgi:hypothetical protein